MDKYNQKERSDLSSEIPARVIPARAILAHDIPVRRTIDVFIFNGMNLLDVAGPVQAFSNAYIDGNSFYDHRYLSLDGKPVKTCSGMQIHADGTLEYDQLGHDLLIPGGNDIDNYLGDKRLADIIANWQSTKKKNRILSICSGALLIAESGLLDGRKATTHWGRKSQVLQDFPKVDWDLDKIYLDQSDIYTSAGVTTGIDLALSIIGQDLGAKVALGVAQELVVYFKRSGGQSQFSNHLIDQYQAMERGNKEAKLVDQAQKSSIEPLTMQITSNPRNNWTLEQMAEFIGMNARTLTRKFQARLSMSPVEFVEQVRLDKARELLAENLVLKQVAAQSGFGDVQRMRRAFKRNFGVTLQDYMKSFG